VSNRVKLGISSCLLGWAVRYDGEHKYDGRIFASWSDDFEFVAVCPEVAIGLGVPRSPIQLVQLGESVRVRGVEDSHVDVTERLHAYGRSLVAELGEVSGYIFKARSPSCGLSDVAIHDERGSVMGEGRGVFAEHLCKVLPLLPVVDEGALEDEAQRENFLRRAGIYHHWHRVVAEGLSATRLRQFHDSYQTLLAESDETEWRRLSGLIDELTADNLKAISSRYIEELMGAVNDTIAGTSPHELL